MFKSNKKNILDFEFKDRTPLLSSDSKGENHKVRIKKIKQRVRLKKIKDINGMQIIYDVIRKKN
tara:strand:+ start:345 stop:536 length:192 start_codon:yes stop_codon:yes gene_type:complete